MEHGAGDAHSVAANTVDSDVGRSEAMRTRCCPERLFPPRHGGGNTILAFARRGGEARRSETGGDDEAVHAWH